MILNKCYHQRQKKKNILDKYTSLLIGICAHNSSSSEKIVPRYLQPRMWKRKLWKRQIFVEAVKEYRFRCHFGHSYRMSKPECGAIFQKNIQRKVMFDRPSFAKQHFKTLWFTYIINSKMNHIANQLIFKIISFQKFSI